MRPLLGWLCLSPSPGSRPAIQSGEASAGLEPPARDEIARPTSVKRPPGSYPRRGQRATRGRAEQPQKPHRQTRRPRRSTHVAAAPPASPRAPLQPPVPLPRAPAQADAYVTTPAESDQRLVPTTEQTPTRQTLGVADPAGDVPAVRTRDPGPPNHQHQRRRSSPCTAQLLRAEAVPRTAATRNLRRASRSWQPRACDQRPRGPRPHIGLQARPLDAVHAAPRSFRVVIWLRMLAPITRPLNCWPLASGPRR